MAQTLRKMGFEAWALKGGLEAWRAATSGDRARDAELAPIGSGA